MTFTECVVIAEAMSLKDLSASQAAHAIHRHKVLRADDTKPHVIPELRPSRVTAFDQEFIVNDDGRSNES